MSDKYLLSICIPTYNRLECLENCLDSINNALTLYFLNIEVCILDNNPEGNAKCIAEKYFNRYPIKYKNNSTNIGVGNNILNVAILYS